MRKITTFFVFITFIALNLTGIQSAAQWTQGQGIDGGDFRCLAKVGTDIYAGSQYGGVFRSSNNGDSWSLLSNGLPGGVSIGKIIDNNGILYAGTTYWSKNPMGIYRSDDNGATWVQKNNGIQIDTLYPNLWSNLSITGLTVCGTYVFAGTEDQGIYRSDNNGETWTYPASDTLMEYYQVKDLHSIGATLFAGTYNAGFLRSSDYGTTWTQHNAGFPAGCVIIDITSSSINLYVTTSHGFYWSPNNGDYWISINAGLSGAATTISVEGNNLFASTYGDNGPQTFKSTDGGTTWTLITSISGNTGTGHYVQALLNSGNYVFAGNIGNYGMSSNGGGVVRSTDGGVTWAEASIGLSGLSCLAVASNGTDIFAGSRYYSGMFKSSDNGANWTKSFLPGTTTNYQVLSMLCVGSNVFAGIYTSGVYISADSGQNWTSTAAIGSSVYALAANATYVFAGTSNSGMRRTANNGTTWTTINTGLPGIAEKTIRAIAVNSSKIYIGTTRGVFRSTNDGTNWVAANGGVGSPGYNTFVKSVAVKGDTLFAGVGLGSIHGVIRSFDNGATWTNVLTVSSGSIVVYALLLDGQNLYAGGSTGVYVSTDWGQTWNSLNATFPSIPEVNSLHIANNILYAGTYGQSVWKYPLAQAPAAYAVTGGGSYCQGTSGTPVGVSNSESSVTYTLYKDAVAQVPTVVGTGSAISFGNQLFGTYTVSGTNGGGTTPMTGSAVIIETPTLGVSVTIAADINPVPAGTAVTLTAVPVNGGTTPSYQWTVNEIIIATNNDVFTYIPANNDAVTCTLTSSETCTTGNPAISNQITIAVIPGIINLQNIVVAGGDTNCYDAIQTIYVAGGGTTFTVQSGGSATMIAGQNIVYLPGTTVDSGGYMYGYITLTGNYCTNPSNPVVSNPVQDGELLTTVPEIMKNYSVRVYPNPTEDAFTLELTGSSVAGMSSVEIFNMNGLKVVALELNGERKQTISVSGLRPGMYFVHVMTGGSRETLKLIKL